MYSKTWYKAIDNKLDKKDIELLNLLISERKLHPEEIKEFSQRLEISVEDVKKRIETLKEKNIILKTNSAVINSVKIWNNYIFVLVKASLKPPVVGMDVEYPTGWSDMVKRIIKFQKERKVDIIRAVYGLHGIDGYDLLLVLTFNDADSFVEMFEILNKEGWIIKAESFRPIEYKDLYIFDPIAVPKPEEFDHSIIEQLKAFEEENKKK